MSGNPNQFASMWEVESEWETTDQYGYGSQPQQSGISAAKMSFFYDQPEYTAPQMPAAPPPTTSYGIQEADEPPLLEELGIEPGEIARRVRLVLDPWGAAVPLGNDELAGPLVFCLLLAGGMLLSGGKGHFGYVYGLAGLGWLGMYALLWLMAARVTASAVASVLGYCLLPVVVLSLIGVLADLRSPVGYFAACTIVIWAAAAASRMFAAMSSDSGLRPLIAYPCALLYGVFTLLVIF